MTEPKATRGRLVFLLLAAVFLGPLVLATWMYYAGQLQPEGRTNHGVLLKPIVNLPEAVAESPLHDTGDGHWVLLYANDASCDEPCKKTRISLSISRPSIRRD